MLLFHLGYNDPYREVFPVVFVYKDVHRFDRFVYFIPNLFPEILDRRSFRVRVFYIEYECYLHGFFLSVAKQYTKFEGENVSIRELSNLLGIKFPIVAQHHYIFP